MMLKTKYMIQLKSFSPNIRSILIIIPLPEKIEWTRICHIDSK
jgi:hypothetical protein